MGRSSLLRLASFLSLLVPAACDSSPTQVTPVANIEVTPSPGAVWVGGTLRLTATLLGPDGSTLTGRSIEWSSSDEGVASVDATGLVTGVSEANTTITAESEGVAAGVLVVVAPAPLASIEMDPSAGTVMEGFTLQLSVTLKDEAGNLLSGRAVTWASAHPEIAMVSQTGLVNGTGEGSTTISATAEGLMAEATVTVDPFGFTSTSPGGAHACAVTDAGEAYCWGTDQDHRLGTGLPEETPMWIPAPVAGGLTFKEVSAGGKHVCGVTTSGEAYCWGANGQGQLGDGSSAEQPLPTPVAGGLTFTTVSAGGRHTCGVTTDGDAYCWGENTDGRLGDGTTTGRETPSLVAGGITFESVAAGLSDHTCGRTTDGETYCWGANGSGQLGDGSTTDRLVPTRVAGSATFASVTAGWDFSCGVTAAGEGFCWGDNESGQLGDGSTTDRLAPTAVAGGLVFRSVSPGGWHTCGLTTSGETYCWGDNRGGRLGNGATADASEPTLVSGGHTFATVTAGNLSTCATTDAGPTYCWGLGWFGILGNGTQSNKLVPTRVLPPG